jgi:hypothetical protein
MERSLYFSVAICPMVAKCGDIEGKCCLGSGGWRILVSRPKTGKTC